MFSCSEHLAGLDASQGTELCTIVETMYSYSVIGNILGAITIPLRDANVYSLKFASVCVPCGGTANGELC